MPTVTRISEALGARDERLAPFDGARDADLRGASSAHLVESPRVIERYLASGRIPDRMLLDHDAFARLEPVLAALPAHVEILVCSRDVVRAVTGYDFHRGALALATRPAPMPPGAMLDQLLADRTGRGADERPLVLLAAEGVVHVDNIGAFFRNARSLGADGVLLDPTSSDPLLRKAVRISMGRVFETPWTRATEWPGALAELRARGAHVVAIETGPDATPIDDGDPLAIDAAIIVLVLGAEGAGVRDATRRECDAILEIPMALDDASLNVAVASAVALHEVGRQHRRRGRRAP